MPTDSNLHSTSEFFSFLTSFVPQVLGALLLLVIGWVVAAGAARMVRSGLSRTRASR